MYLTPSNPCHKWHKLFEDKQLLSHQATLPSPLQSASSGTFLHQCLDRILLLCLPLLGCLWPEDSLGKNRQSVLLYTGCCVHSHGCITLENVSGTPCICNGSFTRCHHGGSSLMLSNALVFQFLLHRFTTLITRVFEQFQAQSGEGSSFCKSAYNEQVCAFHVQ